MAAEHHVILADAPLEPARCLLDAEAEASAAAVPTVKLRRTRARAAPLVTAELLPLRQALFAFAVGGCAFAWLYAMGDALPRLWFDPVQGAVSFGARPSTVAMDFYGRVLVGAVGGMLVGGLLRTRLARPLPPTLAGWGLVLLAVNLALCALYLGLALSQRVPVAEPLPAWYQAR